LAFAKGEGVEAYKVRDYVEHVLKDMELADMVASDGVADPEDLRTGKRGGGPAAAAGYVQYKTAAEISRGVKNGDYSQGTFTRSRENSSEGWVSTFYPHTPPHSTTFCHTPPHSTTSYNILPHTPPNFATFHHIPSHSITFYHILPHSTTLHHLLFHSEIEVSASTIFQFQPENLNDVGGWWLPVWKSGMCRLLGWTTAC
jgi:hypothetical protein